MLIRLRVCTGWSAHLLLAYNWNHIFSKILISHSWKQEMQISSNKYCKHFMSKLALMRNAAYFCLLSIYFQWQYGSSSSLSPFLYETHTKGRTSIHGKVVTCSVEAATFHNCFFYFKKNSNTLLKNEKNLECERGHLFVCLFCCFTSQVNSYGHCKTVSSPNHTCFLGKLEQAVNQ